MRIARDRGVTGTFQGAGGDQVFYQNPILLAAAVHLKAHGPTPRFLRFAAQIARAEGMSFWQILGICPTGDAQAPGSQREWAFISRNLMVCGPGYRRRRQIASACSGSLGAAVVSARARQAAAFTVRADPCMISMTRWAFRIFRKECGHL